MTEAVHKPGKGAVVWLEKAGVAFAYDKVGGSLGRQNLVSDGIVPGYCGHRFRPHLSDMRPGMSSQSPFAPSGLGLLEMGPLTLMLPNDTGGPGHFELELLEPTASVIAANLKSGDLLPFNMEGTNRMVVALVASIEPVSVKDGPGNLVLSKMTHVHPGVYVLTLEIRAGPDTQSGVEQSSARQGPKTPALETLRVTGNHKLRTASGQWVPTESLKVGDLLRTQHGVVRVGSIHQEPAPTTVINLEIAQQHAYLVGQSLLVGKNCGGGLSRVEKDLLRTQARDIWFQETGRRAIWDKLQIHHRVPLEWAHLFPNSNPNRLANLVGIEGKSHSKVTNTWNSWRKSLDGRMPSQADVINKAIEIDNLFPNYWVFSK